MTIEDTRAVVLLSLGATYTVIEDAVQNLEAVPFDDDEIDALLSLEPDHRMKLTARLVELTESLRETLRSLDGRLLQLTADSLLAE